MAFNAESQQHSTTQPARTARRGEAGAGSARSVQLKGALQGLGHADQQALLQPPGPFVPGGQAATALQAQGPIAGDPEAVRSAAAQGVAGGGGQLPHLDTIQSAFGRHDVSSVRGHTSGAATQANEQIGSEAYAAGNDVAFRGAPTLHTAAHEAAHVVQQRAGVSLKGGVGQSGDAYEQHADQVADAVVAGRPAEGILDRMAGAGGPGGAVQQRPLQFKGGRGSAEGIVGGKVSLEDYASGRAPNADEVGKAKSEGAADDMRSMAAQVDLIATGDARSERQLLSAIKAGTVPRYVARVGPKDNFTGHGSFGNAGRPFIFATEPADLRGCKPAEAMLKVGWTMAWIAPNVGKEIVVCIFDTTKSVPTKDKPAGAKIKQGRMEWPQLSAKALADSKFKRAAAAKGIPAAELPDLFDILSNTPVQGDPKTSDGEQKRKCLILRELIDANYGANELYSGMGATITQDGDLGAREVMIDPNGTGLKLTPNNHSFASLGTLTQAEVGVV